MKNFDHVPVAATLAQPDSLKWVQQALNENPDVNQTQFGTLVCSHFGFVNPAGELQVGTCANYLKKLGKRGLLELPEQIAGTTRQNKDSRDAVDSTRDSGSTDSPEALKPLPLPSGLPEDAGAIQNLQVVQVKSEKQHEIWKRAMQEHYLGGGRGEGNLIRYLIYTEHGLVAAASFESAKKKMYDRDRWIGWTPEERAYNRNFVLICMSRFLVRGEPNQCFNLASMVMAAILRNLRNDWFEKYKVAPYLVESFVDLEKFDGACYRATNWIQVGTTAGRGDQDRDRTAKKSIKAIFMYPLVRNFRQELELPPEPEDLTLPGWVCKSALLPYEGLKDEKWSVQEFGCAEMGHQDRNASIIAAVELLSTAPRDAAHGSLGMDYNARRRWYKLVRNPKVNPGNILSGHRECTLRRAKAVKVALFIQDTMTVSLRGKHEIKGLGPIWSNGDASVDGIEEHATIVVDPEQGYFLGILDVSYWTRERGGKGNKKLPPDQRESAIWAEHARKVNECARYMTDTQCIIVCDRGADSVRFISECKEMEYCDLIVRAKSNRILIGESKKLFELMAYTPSCGTMTVKVDRKSKRVDASGNVISEKQPARTAVLDLIYRKVTLSPSEEDPNADPVEVTCVTAAECGKIEHGKRIVYHLLTTLPVTCAEDAKKIVEYYSDRWIIEEWHGVLKKDGCNIENSNYDTVDRIMNVITIFMIIAWWFMLVLQLARKQPDLSSTTIFEDDEIDALAIEAECIKKKLDLSKLWNVVYLIAMKAGYGDIGNKWGKSNAPPPGYKVFIKGYVKLREMCRKDRLKKKLEKMRQFANTG